MRFPVAKAGTPWRASNCALVALRLEQPEGWVAALNSALVTAGGGGGFILAPSPGVAKRCSTAGNAAYARLRAYRPTEAEIAPLRKQDPDLDAAWRFYAEGQVKSSHELPSGISGAGGAMRTVRRAGWVG